MGQRVVAILTFLRAQRKAKIEAVQNIFLIHTVQTIKKSCNNHKGGSFYAKSKQIKKNKKYYIKILNIKNSNFVTKPLHLNM